MKADTPKVATIRDVAGMAGVSVGTVSRVLAGNSTVKIGLLTRVQSAIEALDFRPNQTARALRANKINVVGLLIPDILNPFFVQLANELESLASEAGYALILSSSHNDRARETRQFEALIEHKPAAVFFVAADGSPEFKARHGTKVISVDRRTNGFPSVNLDQGGSAALAVDHLVGLGHRRIAYFAGPESTVNARERLRGFLDRSSAFSAKGIPVEVEVFQGEFDYASGESLARILFQQPKQNRVTAIAAASDQQAIGAIRAARDVGLSVPADVSIIGFDDITLSNLIVPRLTTIQQPVSEMARHAFRLAMEDGTETVSSMLMGRLVVRDSTADCANTS
jgi:LacI family transcriptional regulator